ncbi:choice-of-anchor B family protein [Shewanella submarina]|uniref:Choice-of-anchor B family protein n=1 Tax=Shewanella submarina TaxID=2016376 RepID=A0ABV7GKW1_9GAMM|nr:choice-of-anchor B family protein [Shewanella submarina]MCL1035753.1 choice-of-anchor B family protein [Shewanella submarina]
MRTFNTLLPGLVAAGLGFAAVAIIPEADAHAEHDKARFVAPNGKDKGFCDNPLRPCNSLAYAIRQANKGDKVLVAEGEYSLSNADELFLLTSDIVPVYGGYNRVDHFLSQAPSLNKTLLTGVPPKFAGQLTERGFKVISDGIGQYGTELDNRLAQMAALQQSQPGANCSGGTASGFACDNIDLVSHMALSAFSSSPGAANDIWGHVDLNSGTEYAIIGLQNGTAVVSLADPESPVEVGTVQGSGTSWRDIKVLQWFDSQAVRWKAHAYVSSEGSDQIQIIDLSNLPDSISLVTSDSAVTSAHNVYISHVDYTTNTALNGMSPLLHIVGQGGSGGAFRTYSLSQPGVLNNLFNNSGATLADYTHDAASMVVDDGRAQANCQTPVCTVFMDFNVESMRLWNITNPSQSRQLADVSYQNAEYVHSGWWSEDKRHIYVHDELDERRVSLNTTLRVFKVDDLSAPQLVKVWTGPTAAIDHNGYARGSRYYMSNYQRGVTILDISDPANPVEAGFFDTFPASDSNAFNGVWGVYPYLPSGLVLASDINSGLYVLKDASLNSTQGQISFASPQTSGGAGDLLEVKVQRPAGSGAVSVQWELLEGSAISNTDFQQASGTLNWADADLADKTIQVTTLDSGKKQQLLAWVRLFNPSNGATLVTPSYHSLNIGEAVGSVGFAVNALDGDEGGTVQVQVQRTGGKVGALKVSYQLQSDSAVVGSDVQDASGELNWTDGDDSVQSFNLSLLDDDAVEGEESFKVTLTAIDGAPLGQSELTVTINDNDRNNTAPTVSAGEDAQANVGQTVNLTASATDAEGDTISYQWQQSAGTSVSVTNANQANASFVAPSSAGTLTFIVTATDSLGAANQDAVNISVVAAPEPPTTGGGGGGSLGWLTLMLLAMLRLKRR